MRKFLVVLRYDDEDFSLHPKTGLPELYSRKLKPYDQTSLIEKLHPVLKKHKAKANIAVSYGLLKRTVEHLALLRTRGSGHLFTWHLHLKWDPTVQKDFGEKKLRSCYLGGYKGDDLEKLLDMADGAFAKAFGETPKVSLNACFSSSDELMASLERRGYLVQGDYTANTDYRVMDKVMKYKFDGVRPFKGGPGGPCYPYAPDEPYRANYNDAMLMGDMKLVVVPITQLSPGMGIPHQDTYQNPDFEIKMIKKLYRARKGMTVLILAMHPHALMFGYGSADENIARNLASLEKVLNYCETLEGMQYANYLDVRKHYLAWERSKKQQEIIVRDVGNGFLIYDGANSVKCQSVGHGEHFDYEDPVMGGEPTPSVCIGQDNGIAQWLVGGQHLIGPKIPDKLLDKTYRRTALVTTEVELDGRDLKLPQLNMQSALIDNKNSIGFATKRTVDGLGVKTKYLFNRTIDTLRVETTLSGKGTSTAAIQHRYELNPKCKLQSRDASSIVFSHKDVKFRIVSPNGLARVRQNENSYTVRTRLGTGKSEVSYLELLS